MAKIKPMALIESMSGKVCSHTNVYFAVRNGKVYTGTLCNPSTKEPNSAQIAHRQRFATATANALSALSDAEQLLVLKAGFANQTKYKTLRGYAFALEMAKLVG